MLGRFLAVVALAASFFVPASLATTYFISPTGNDANNGLSSGAPWLTPNHALNCGDVISAAAGTYAEANFRTGQWGVVTCAAGNNVAWLKCATFDTCKIAITGANDGMAPTRSYWGVQGWEITSTAGSGSQCFNAFVPNGTTSVHNVIFANNIANGCGNGGLTAGSFSSTVGTDYLVYVGNIAYNAAQNNANCYSGIDMVFPVNTDTQPGTHIYIAGNFSFGNVDPNPCAGGLPTDGHGILLDSLNNSTYTGQILIDNNISVFNGASGFQVFASATAPVYVRNNTFYGNETGSINANPCGEASINTASLTQAFGNLVQTTTNTCHGAVAEYALVGSFDATTDIYRNNFIYSAAGNNISVTLTQVLGNLSGTSPAFANPVQPSAPSCGSFASVPACMASVVANFTPTTTAAKPFGYQVPSAPVSDGLFPQWLCSVTNLPAGLVTMGCASTQQAGTATGRGNVQGAGQIFIGPPTPPATVSIQPTSQVLAVSTTQNFVATVTNDSFAQGVTWTLAGTGCSGATCGTLSATTSKSGVPITYTAPASAPTPNAVVLTATSNLNPAGFANANITITGAPPPVVVGNICGSLQFQAPAATNTFTCPPSNGSFIAFTIAVSTSDTPTGVQACLPLPPGSPGACFNLIKACDPTNVCQGITTPGGITQIWYGIGLPIGITTLIVTNSPAAGGVLDVSAIDAQNINAFGGASFSSGNNTATTNPVGPGIVAVANSLTVSTLSTTGGATAVAAPFTFVPLSGGDGVAYQLNSTDGTTTPNWTTTSGTWSGFTATFTGGTTTPVISVAMNPTAASVKVNTTLAVTPTVTNDTAGVSLTLTGGGCSGATCGTLSSSTTASGVAVTYTAPAAVPSPATVTITAASITNPAKTATTTITVTSNPIVVTVSPGSASVQTSATQTFSCTVTNDAAAAGCDWALTGAGCSGATCGGISVSHTASGVTLTYTGPAAVPSPATVSLTATSTTDNTKSALATITVIAAPAIVVSVSPGSANVQTTNVKAFSCTVTNDAGAAGCDWALTGAGCSGATCGTISTTHTASGVTLNYTAPGSVPSPATVSLKATSTTDNTKSATATITVVAAPVLTVVVAPGSASVQTGHTQSFTPTVTNDGGNLGVDWTLSGAGCSGATCGTISLTHTASGTPTVYTAPATVPSPATVTITATSTTDNTKSASSTITVFALAIVVSVSPGTATVPVNGTQNFTPTVTNDAANAGVDWTLGACTTFTEAFNEGSLPAIWIPTNRSGVEGGGSFSSSHISLSQGVLQMNVTQDGTTSGSVGAEIQLNRQFGYGTYSWSMQAAGTSATQGGAGSAVSGQISSTFQYSGGNPVPTEIDAPEIEGQFPTQIEYTTWLNGVKSDFHQTTLANPQNTYHIYKYVWSPGQIIFSLDGTPVATTTTNVPTAPAYPLANLWGTNSSSFGGVATPGVTRYMYVNNFTYSNCGTLSATHTASGAPVTYTAPPNVPSPATVTITATSTTDNTKSATSTITIGTAPNITIAVAPTSASVTTNGVQNFTATLTNDTSNQGATWALTGGGCSGATCGSLSTAGSASGTPITYTAPNSVPSPATVTLTATSVTDPTKTATATITVTSPVVTVSVSPKTATFQAGSGSQLFTASVANSGATPAWTLSCSASNCGSITPTSGTTTTYTPPPSATSTITVTLTATVTGPVSGTATITVNPSTGPPSCSGSNCPAFMGAGGTAQGAGAVSLGGRGGVVYNITCMAQGAGGCGGPTPCNGATCGSGQTPTTGYTNASFRDCIEASGPRNCVFQTNGTITQTASLNVRNPFLTVAGQTAPGEVVLGGVGSSGQAPQVQTHDVIIRYLTYDGYQGGGSSTTPCPGSGPNTGTVGWEMANGTGTDTMHNIFDHGTGRWVSNKYLQYQNDTTGNTTLHDNTYQFMLLFEPCISHPVGPLLSAAAFPSRMVNNDWHHNMLINSGHRLPLLFDTQNVRWVSNITYNFDYFAAAQNGGTDDYIDNWWVGGNLNAGNSNPHPLNATLNAGAPDGTCINNCDLPPNPSIYMSGNRCGPAPSGGMAIGTDYQCSAEEAGTDPEGFPETANPIRAGWQRATPLPTETFPISPDATATLNTVVVPIVGNSRRLDNVNCTGAFITSRDSQDSRVIAQYQVNGSGGEFEGPNYNGPANAPGVLVGSPCTQSLHDGIPDAWKTLYGLSTTDVNLYKTVSPTGLTYFEDYIDGLPPGAVAPYISESFNGALQNPNIWFSDPCPTGVSNCSAPQVPFVFGPIFTFQPDGNGNQDLQIFNCASTNINTLCQNSSSSFGPQNAVTTNTAVHAGYVCGSGTSPRPNCVTVGDGNGMHDETWYRFHFRYPAGYTPTPGDQNAIMELHVDDKTTADAAAHGGIQAYSTALEVTSGGSCPGSPAFCTTTGTNPALYLQVPGGATSCGTACRVIAYTGASNSLQINHWYDIVLHMVWDNNPAVGLAELWIDGSQVLSNHMATHYTRSDGTQSYGENFGFFNYPHWANYTITDQFENVIWGPTRASIGF